MHMTTFKDYLNACLKTKAYTCCKDSYTKSLFCNLSLLTKLEKWIDGGQLFDNLIITIIHLHKFVSLFFIPSEKLIARSLN
jgi:hypothetical protein